MLFSPTAKDYALQFMRLLPRGRIWHRGVGLTQDADIEILMPTWAALHARLNDLIAEIFPCTTSELLPEWEASLGLPDECTGPLDTLQARTAAVCAKFAARGGQSAQYFIDLAAAHGFTIEIATFAPFRVDINRVEEPLYDAGAFAFEPFLVDANRVEDPLYNYFGAYSDAWSFTWAVQAPATEVTYFRTDLSAVEEPLASWGNKILECLILAYAPAHTIVIFQYGDRFSTWDAGASIWDGGESLWDQWGAPAP